MYYDYLDLLVVHTYPPLCPLPCGMFISSERRISNELAMNIQGRGEHKAQQQGIRDHYAGDNQ